MARGKGNTIEKSDNKAKPEKEKVVKPLSNNPFEDEHLHGKHKTEPSTDCGYCIRGVTRDAKKAVKRKAYFAANPA